MLRRVLFALSSLAMLPFVPVASAEDLAGQASIIDGDTIEIHGERILLLGIDAPEHDQLCEAAGSQYAAANKQPWPCLTKSADRRSTAFRMTSTNTAELSLSVRLAARI